MRNTFSFEQHPALRRACVLMGYDSGAINRHCPEDEYVAERESEMRLVRFTDAELAEAERVVAGLNEQDLACVCNDTRWNWPPSVQPGSLTDKVLNAVFDGSEEYGCED